MVFTYPPGLFTQLEFDKIRADLIKRCVGNPAKQKVEDMPIMVNAEQIRTSLATVYGFCQMTKEGQAIQVRDYQDLTKAFKWLEIADSIMSIEDLFEMKSQMEMIVHWYTHFNVDRRSNFGDVYNLLKNTTPLPKELALMDAIFDVEGEIKDSASPELKRIRKEIGQRQRALQKAFNQVLEQFRKLGYLTDNYESIRNGRRVLAVNTEDKKKISGIILDESSTGKTVFIQPNEAIQIENELFEVRNDERREINRILKELSNKLRIQLGILKSTHQVIIEIDFVRAKAIQASVLKAEMPLISEDALLHLERAKHPLLLLKHQGNLDEVIDFDLSINSDNQIIVVSGPNAGGKSITLKAVGLLALMCQSGLLVPIAPTSTIGIYHQFMGDIGDQQSIEQDLSTYTSHLQNMRVFTERAIARTLFLIDEFGSGTEPVIGGAIAEAILLSILRKKAQGMITTHYGNLKVLASNTPGISNASMDFDRKALRPTYRLRPGVPGSSFAFEMANRSGLSRQIIKRARAKIGHQEGKLEYLLTSLQREKQELEKKIKHVANREKDLDRLVKNYERLQRELDVKRKRLKMEEKAFRLVEQTQSNQKLEQLIRELREKEKLASAKKLAQDLKLSKKTIHEEISQLQQEIIEKSGFEKQNRPLGVGDHVRMKIGGLTGTIDRIQKGKATVLIGNMRLDAALTELEPSRAPIELNPVRSVSAQFQQVNAHHKLDIRGLRREEAFNRLEKFVDQALIANLRTIEIIHGKGNGTLKQAVQDKLKEYRQSFQAYHPSPEKGGDGVTFVDLF